MTAAESPYAYIKPEPDPYLLHCAMALTEGLCPDHRMPLEPEPRLPGIGGYCRPCGCWLYYEPDAKPFPTVSYAVAFNPINGEPIWHDWMAEKP